MSFLKNNGNTIPTSNLLNLTFVQRALYLINSYNFYSINCDYEDEAVSLCSFAKNLSTILNKDMTVYLKFLSSILKSNINIIFEKSFLEIIKSYISMFTNMIKYHLIEEEEQKKYLEHCFDILKFILDIDILISKKFEKFNYNFKMNKQKYEKGQEDKEVCKKLIFDYSEQLYSIYLKYQKSLYFIFDLMESLYVFSISMIIFFINNLLENVSKREFSLCSSGL